MYDPIERLKRICVQIRYSSFNKKDRRFVRSGGGRVLFIFRGITSQRKLLNNGLVFQCCLYREVYFKKKHSINNSREAIQLILHLIFSYYIIR